MVQAIERYMKQAIVDRNHAVASAALMSSFVSELEPHEIDVSHCVSLVFVEPPN